MKYISSNIYNQIILAYPKIWLAFIALIVGISGIYVNDFRLDASADSLILENDQDLRYHRTIGKSYGTDDFLIITYTPVGELLSED